MPLPTGTHVQSLWHAGGVQVELRTEVPGCPQRVLEVLADPQQHARALGTDVKACNILEDDDQGRRFEVHISSPWRFLILKGRAELHTEWEADYKQRKVNYRLKKPGFLKAMDGAFTVEDIASSLPVGSPRVRSMFTFRLAIKPKLAPPLPLRFLLHQQATEQVKTATSNLVAYLTHRIQSLPRTVGLTWEMEDPEDDESK